MSLLPARHTGRLPGHGATIYFQAAGYVKAIFERRHSIPHIAKFKFFKGFTDHTPTANSDSTLDQIESNLRNSISRREANHPYGIVPGEQKKYGLCDFEVNLTLPKKVRIAEPRPAVRGQAARIWLYMVQIYRVKLSPKMRQMMSKWATDHPVSAWEMERDKRIREWQGNSNPYVRPE